MIAAGDLSLAAFIFYLKIFAKNRFIKPIYP